MTYYVVVRNGRSLFLLGCSEVGWSQVSCRQTSMHCVICDIFIRIPFLRFWKKDGLASLPQLFEVNLMQLTQDKLSLPVSMNRQENTYLQHMSDAVFI